MTLLLLTSYYAGCGRNLPVVVALIGLVVTHALVRRHFHKTYPPGGGTTKTMKRRDLKELSKKEVIAEVLAYHEITDSAYARVIVSEVREDPHTGLYWYHEIEYYPQKDHHNPSGLTLH